MVGGDDEMVEEVDLRDFAKLDEAAGEVEIGFAWFEIAGGMVVRDHDGMRAPFERFLEDITRESQRRIGRVAERSI